MILPVRSELQMSGFPPAASLPAPTALAERRIHLWSVRLDPPGDRVEALRRLLSADEVARADRFHFERHRRRFTVGRAALRILLGAYLARDPAEISFVYGEKGKPALAPAAGAAPDLRFNLSNSHELALVGVVRGREIGVDVEHLRTLDDSESIARRFFSAAESETLLALPPEQREIGFFNCWTRKEAYLKAVGDGLTAPLDAFDVTLVPGEPPRMLTLEGSPERARSWTLSHLEPAPGYVGALAIEEGGWSLDGWRFDP